MAKKTSVHIPYTEPAQEYHRVIARLAVENSSAGGRILDFGCGLGFILSFVRAELPEAELYAADIDPTCLEITAKNCPGTNLIQLTGANDFVNVGEEYDVCIMSHVLEHMNNPKESLLAAMDHLRCGGYMVVAVPNPVRPHIFWKSVRRKHYVNRGHVCAWDRSHWMNFLENICKVNVVKYAEDTCPVFPRRLARFAIVKKIECKLSRLLPWLSFSNIAVIKKNT